MYLRLWGGRGVALVLVTSKKKAMVVAGSTPPKYHTDVPLTCHTFTINEDLVDRTQYTILLLHYPMPISFSDTDGPAFFKDAHGPIAPAILNSLE